MRVRLHIDRLVFKGISANDREALVAGIVREFTRQFSVPGAAERFARQDAAMRPVRAAVNVGRCATAQHIGARAVRGIISGER